MAEVMARVRTELGDEAIIISSTEGKRGEGVDVRVAIEQIPRPTAPIDEQEEDTAPAPFFADNTANPHAEGLKTQLKLIAPHLAKQIEDIHDTSNGRFDPNLRASELQKLKRLLTFHGFNRRVGRSLLNTYNALAHADLDETLTRVVELRYATAPIPNTPRRPLMLIGPPGSGKTTIAAKLAARSVLHGQKPELITTDTVRSGAVSQIENLAEAMQISVSSAETPAELRAKIQSVFHNAEELPPIIIDTPATNPYAASEINDLQKFILASEAEPILILPAGGDGAELADHAKAFSKLGATRVIVSKLDASRRIGGLLSAIDTARLPIANLSSSPYLGRAFEVAKPELLAKKLLAVPPQILSANAQSPVTEPKRAKP